MDLKHFWNRSRESYQLLRDLYDNFKRTKLNYNSRTDEFCGLCGKIMAEEVHLNGSELQKQNLCSLEAKSKDCGDAKDLVNKYLDKAVEKP